MVKEIRKEYDVAIIGGGVAGLSAAMYARRFELNVILFDELIGGTAVKAGHIENYPGFKLIEGFELVNKIKEQTLNYNPNIINENVNLIEKKSKGFVISTEKQKYNAKSIILATGTEWRKLGVSGEQKFKNKGVHYCAICDGYFYKNKVVAVVGSGNTASREALIVAQTAKKVYMIIRGDGLRSDPITRKRVMNAKNIELVTKAYVTEIFGDTKVNGIKLNKEFNGSNELKLD